MNTSSHVLAAMIVVAMLQVVAGCATPTRDEVEAAKNTFSCQLDGGRLLVKFDAGEARLLMPDGERVALYQIPAASGVRFSNGTLELRGKGSDLTLMRNGVPAGLTE